VSPFCDLYGGAVLNATITMYAYAAIGSATDSDTIEFQASDVGIGLRYSISEGVPQTCALDLHLAILRRVVRDYNGGKWFPISISTWSDVPPGSGLGSSSTLVVAMLKGLVEYLQLPLGEYEIARIAFDVERIDLGLSGGRQDQYAATFGGVNYMEFSADNHVVVNPLRIKNWILSELEASLLLYDTGVRRQSAHVIDQQITQMKTAGSVSIEALQAMKEEATMMKAALLRGNLLALAEIMNRGWTNKKSTAAGVSNSHIDQIDRAGRDAGAIAAKVSGAGGGGFMMFVVDPAHRNRLIKGLEPFNGRSLTVNFCEHGTQGWRAS
jgi:D-glycero-alpha-D-manno-heptose-7-phosphate kinase